MVSIIIPAYNAEKYIKDCIQSLERQSFSDYEIIIVNDGSKDKTGEVCKALAESDKRINVITQENTGVSSARNRGIQEACGEYIMFVDADDELCPNALEELFTGINESGADLVVAGFEISGDKLRLTDIETLKKIAQKETVDNCIDQTTALRHMITIDPNNAIYGYVWRNLYKAEIIHKHGVLFDTSIKISEDYKFLVEYMMFCTKIMILPESVYIYKISETSVTTKYMRTIHEDMVRVNQWVNQNVCKKCPDVLAGYEACLANTYLSHVQNLCNQGTPFNLMKRIEKSYSVKAMYQYMPHIISAYKQKNSRKKAQIAFGMFALHLDWLYVLLFSLKAKTLVNR